MTSVYKYTCVKNGLIRCIWHIKNIRYCAWNEIIYLKRLTPSYCSYHLCIFYNISSFKRLNSKLYRYIGKHICFRVWTFFARLLTNYFFAKYLRPLYIFSQRRHDIKCNVKGKFYAFIELKMKVLYVYIPSAFSLSNTIYMILLYFSHIFSQ